MKCLYYQWKISKALDSENQKANLPMKHLAQCPDCRRFHRRLAAMGRSLKRDATVNVPRLARPAEPPGVAERVGRGAQWPVPIGQTSKPSVRRKAAWAGAALAVAVCLATFLVPQQPSSSPVERAAVDAPRTQPQKISALTKLSPSKEMADPIFLNPRLLADVQHPMQSLVKLTNRTIDRQLSSGTNFIQSTGGKLLPNFKPVSVESGNSVPANPPDDAARMDGNSF
jgi:hypothetical protein